MTEVAELPIEHVLLREIQHRINNEFGSAISLVSVAAAHSGSTDVKAALIAVREILHRYADVHRALQMPDQDTPIDAAAYLRRLCLSISRSKLDQMKIKLVLAAAPMWLQSDRCWRLGMIVYELITNAAKHAFVGRVGIFELNCPRVSLPTAGCWRMDQLSQKFSRDRGSKLSTS